MNILLVEDDPVLASGISRVLEGHGMNVETINNGSTADALVRQIEFSAVILDIGLPGLDGFEVLRRMRQRNDVTPVLLLTARDAIQDRVHGLEVGADDYLIKPFATPELVARVKALIRRSRGADNAISLGDLTMDYFARRVQICGQTVDLSVREWTVLEYLVRNLGRVLSKQQIIDAIFTTDTEVSLNAIEVYVSRLRLKLAGSGLRIRTIRGFGYLLEGLETS
ncbi:response regulator transcription factor [Limnobacter sp.]|uniref:response regulator transcription factor n=1 Tax=Limnobacter sp. TaxID=2003368 RepID=UPI0025901FAE|nr:response regulator transcription factor [Limnobacter sp.]